MPRSETETLLGALGFPPHVDRIYHRVLPQTGRELVSVAAALLRSPEALIEELGPLMDHDIVTLVDARVFVASPPDAVALMLVSAATDAARTHTRIEGIAEALSLLSATGARPAPGDVSDIEPLDGELSRGGNVPGLLSALLRQSKGDLLQFRPDQWRTPGPDPMTGLLREIVGSGRRLRSIYPVQALQESRGVLVARAEIGEQIRIAPELPTRMLIIGTTHAILPEPLGYLDEPRSLIRQRGLVEALTLWFEQVWNRSDPVPELERGEARPDLRRFLLEQLAAGAQDEQIARRLGVSLRTVRRRVADVLSEVGADTRFQAGVEAVRRGWL